MCAFLLEGRAYYYRIYYLYCNKSVNTTTTNSTRIGKKKSKSKKQLTDPNTTDMRNS